MRMSRKEKSCAGRSLASWERKNADQCFGEEKELDSTISDVRNRAYIIKEKHEKEIPDGVLLKSA